LCQWNNGTEYQMKGCMSLKIVRGLISVRINRMNRE